MQDLSEKMQKKELIKQIDNINWHLFSVDQLKEVLCVLKIEKKYKCS